MGNLRHEYTAASIELQTDAVGDIESLELVARRVGVGAITNTLVRSGSSDTFTNTQTTVTFSVSVETTVASGDPLPFTLSDSTLGLSAEPLTVQPGTEPLACQTSDALSSVLPEGLDDPGYGAYWGWEFVNTQPVVLVRSEGGGIRAYYTQYTGPDAILEERAQQFPEEITKAVNNLFYAASKNPALTEEKTPWAHVLLSLSKKVRVAPEWDGPLDPAAEGAGFLFGLTAQAADDIEGLMDVFFVLTPATINYMYADWHVCFGNPTTEQIEHVEKVETKMVEAGLFAKQLWDVWLAASPLPALKAAASLELDEAREKSEHAAWVNAYLVDLIIAINNEYQEASAFKRGEIKGRVTLEVVLLLLPATQAKTPSQMMSKVKLLQALKVTDTVNGDPQLLAIVNKVEALASGVEPPPVIKGLTIPSDATPGVVPAPAPLFSAEVLKVGEDVGSISERIWNRAMVSIAQGTPRRQAFSEAMKELPANAHDVKIMERLRQVVDLELGRLPDLPGNPSPQQVDEWLEALKNDFDKLWVRGEWEDLLSVKGLQSTDGVVIPGGAGNLRGHHIVPEQIINRLKTLDPAFATLHERGSPLKVFTHPEHYGSGPNSLHNRMYRVYNGDKSVGKTVLNPNRLAEYDNASDMMDALLAFYDSYPEYADLAKATRGFCVKKGIQFTRRSPFEPINPPWPWLPPD